MDTWKIHLSMKIIFRLPKDILVGVDLEKSNQSHFDWPIHKVFKKVKESDFTFGYVDSFCYVSYKIKLIWLRGGWFIGSPSWSKNKKIAINFESKNNCFLCAVTVNLHHIKKLARILIELLILHFHQKLWLGRDSFSLCWKRLGRVCEITPITPI